MSASEPQNRPISTPRNVGAREFVVLMVALMSINAIAIDIMLPAMESIKLSFHETAENAQHYIIFCYLIGLGTAQLVFGPLSDRFGRRVPVLIGLVIYAIASLACTFAPSFTTLLILRLIQGCGAAATRVLVVSIIRDRYSGNQMAQVMSTIMMVFMMVPVVAPSAGQLLLFLGPWQTIFLFMAIASTGLIFWLYFRLPETLQHRSELNFNAVFASFRLVLTNRVSLCYSLAFSSVLGALFTSFNTAEQIYDGIYKIGTWFPAVFALAALFTILSSFINSRLVGRLGTRRISHTMLIAFMVFSAIWAIGSFFADGVLPLPYFLVIYILTMFSFGFLGANFNALAMEPLGKVAGTASSIFGFLQTIVGSVLGLVIGQQFNGTTTPIAIGYFGVGLLALIFVLIAEKGRLLQTLNHTKNTNIFE